MKKIIQIVIIITLLLLFVVYGIDSKGSDEVICIVRHDLENGNFKYEEEHIEYSYSLNRNLLKPNNVVIRIYLDDKEYILRNVTSKEFWKKGELNHYHLMSHSISDKGHHITDMTGVLSKDTEKLAIFYNDGSNAAFIPTHKDIDANDVLEYFRTKPKW